MPPKKIKNTAEKWNYMDDQKRGTSDTSSRAAVLSVLKEMGPVQDEGWYQAERPERCR